MRIKYFNANEVSTLKQNMKLYNSENTIIYKMTFFFKDKGGMMPKHIICESIQIN